MVTLWIINPSVVGTSPSLVEILSSICPGVFPTLVSFSVKTITRGMCRGMKQNHNQQEQTQLYICCHRSVAVLYSHNVVNKQTNKLTMIQCYFPVCLHKQIHAIRVGSYHPGGIVCYKWFITRAVLTGSWIK